MYFYLVLGVEQPRLKLRLVQRNYFLFFFPIVSQIVYDLWVVLKTILQYDPAEFLKRFLSALSDSKKNKKMV